MNANLILDRIENMVDPHIAIWDDALRILITGIMSTRTKDEVTDRASLRLFCRFPSIEKLSKASPAVVGIIIFQEDQDTFYMSGNHYLSMDQKTRGILPLSKILVANRWYQALYESA